MPSIETNAQSFKTLIRTRTLGIGLTILLLWWAERGDTSAAILAGWQILFLGAILSLVFSILGKIKHLTGFLLPLVFLIDGVLVGLWVSISGGPVSFYIPYFLIILASAILVLTPRIALLVVAGLFILFMAALYWDYSQHISVLFESSQINFVSSMLEKLTPDKREMLFREQALRWFFFFILMAVTCALLMRQVWVREERLRTKERALEQKRYLIQMGELTGRIAHGVNTPLGLISGNLELVLAETRKDSKIHKNLIQIENYVQRAIRSVRDILDYSRQNFSEIKSITLKQIIDSVVSAIQPKLKKSQGQLVLDIDPLLPEMRAYPEGLFQVFLNLVENAVDSISVGGLITFSARFNYRSMRLSAEDRRGEIQVVIRDTGKGISPADLPHIFEPFYSTKGFGKGTGLGLAIVKRIVDEHKGKISVESRLGEGTVFTLLFPTDGLGSLEDSQLNDSNYNESNSVTKEKKNG